MKVAKPKEGVQSIVEERDNLRKVKLRIQQAGRAEQRNKDLASLNPSLKKRVNEL